LKFLENNSLKLFELVIMDNKLLLELQSKQRDELNIIAKKLKIKSYRRLNKDQLIEKFLEIDETSLQKYLHITWWDKYHNHIYGIASVLGLLACVFFYFWMQGDISVVPKSRTISPRINQKFILKILNNKDYPIYQVDLRICVEIGDLSLDDIKLDLKQETKLKSEIGGAVISHDIFGISVIEEDGTKADHRFIYDVDAHSTKELEVEVNAGNISEKSTISFKIVRIDKEPTQIVSFDPFKQCQSDKHNFKTYYETGKMMMRQKRYNEARICFGKAIEIDPKSAKAHNNIGVAFVLSGDNNKAVSEFEEAIKLDPELGKPYINLASILINEGNYIDAIKNLEIVEKLNSPEKMDALIMWGECLARQQDIDGAVGKFKEVIELDSGFGPAYFHWGVLLKNQSDCEKAIDKFKKAAELEHPLKLDSYGMWGACLETLGREKEALNKYQKIIKFAPNSIAANKSRNSINGLKEKSQTN